jgi:hypothetical protein
MTQKGATPLRPPAAGCIGSGIGQICLLVVAWADPVFAPLPDITNHLKKAKAIGLEAAHGHRPETPGQTKALLGQPGGSARIVRPHKFGFLSKPKWYLCRSTQLIGVLQNILQLLGIGINCHVLPCSYGNHRPG